MKRLDTILLMSRSEQGHPAGDDYANNGESIAERADTGSGIVFDITST